MFRTIATAGLFLFFLSLNAQTDNETKVLFMGTSYTYFWNLPQVVMALAKSQNEHLVTRQSTAGGANLGHHWRSQRGLISREKMSVDNWDFVVLQDQSLRGIQAPDSLLYFASKWKTEIKKSGATPLLYMTWARSYNPLMTVPIAKAYEDVANSIEVPVVPVGKIWAKARSLRPDIQLYNADGSHPSPLGTYLTACAFYQVLTGNVAIDLPSTLTALDEDGEKVRLMIVPRNDASFCQNVVREVLKDYRYLKMPELIGN